ncbi:NAD(P)H-dependent glycerol-3-phosphate dehydrogenase [Synechococcus sp. PCC 7336]|uniref:NAD(P)H-dependent glycerol-3-phosphate dehydrogenase n=1 Tax=Synechococcus sp. PCC 7336 TaxID=195250 RepID=UPI001D0D2AFE|nr:NAD(P)H-dependent glycerol-3-phosphate dehydrogenase [Synechococcus sp. PCC 7336]
MSVCPQVLGEGKPVRPQAIAILGAGAWGTTLAGLARSNGADVRLWSRRGERSLAEVAGEAGIVLSAISMQGVSSVIEQLQQGQLAPDCILVSATKGLDAATLQTPSQLWQQAFPEHPAVVLSGPNLSQEIDRGLPAATVVASDSELAAATVQVALASDRFRIYTNTDPIGTELGGSLKNIMAIAVGVCDGLDLGANAKAALVTRGLAEMLRIGLHFGARAETFSGLSGLGDLLATCSGLLSRNYQVGYYLAEGRSLAEALDLVAGTAEGVNTTPVMLEIAHREGIPVPIVRQVNRLLQGLDTPVAAVEALMDRELTSEVSS